MTQYQITRAPQAATAVDRRAARAQIRIQDGELNRVRAAAISWRNGLGALLAGLIGFGLIKGRTDVGQLASPYDAIVGGTLAAALVAGGFSAWLLMRAAHGRPAAVSTAELVDRSTNDPETRALQDETLDSWLALRRGVLLAFGCGFLLCSAVATTWYGPPKDGPQVEARWRNGAVLCGTVESDASGALMFRTPAGTVPLDLTGIVTLRAVDTCPTGAS
ncbi:hypothetical protein FNH09_09715 [Streptomyces adustus]|uniref:Uncharacterized protein n=1 Tax=Streptomyces adustus TaxID=1609272 RepID=A0A5N8VBW7_9ACTN|nr:hypothetical protein [Streptomyces adustus]MPY31548.1 hypothetical protein [Streptomyces adustus]